VTLDVYSVTGQRVRPLENRAFEAGEHRLTWDGTDASGKALASGVYFVNLRADGASYTQKLFILP
jgi:flagellar hook assembly protein FlgD